MALMVGAKTVKPTHLKFHHKYSPYGLSNPLLRALLYTYKNTSVFAELILFHMNGTLGSLYARLHASEIVEFFPLFNCCITNDHLMWEAS